ncbi:hypothetical protein HanIR_Chr04g0170251 [Helianthus annuus]|nr:hypothetical protein HanIR_Chr04g0170251 [Helianthus annuus]
MLKLVMFEVLGLDFGSFGSHFGSKLLWFRFHLWSGFFMESQVKSIRSRLDSVLYGSTRSDSA